MFLWIIAIVLLAVIGIIGYYQGAIRVAFSLIGLLLGAALALPLGGLLSPVLGIFGLHHPVLLSFVGPAVAYLIILIAFKIGGFTVNRKLDTYYKYHDSDTRRLLFERFNQRLGICLGLVNATIYFILLCVVIYAVGYFTIQVGTSSADSFTIRMVNALSRDLEKTGMIKAIAPFNPATDQYYTGSDILGDVFHTPLLENRLSTYPPFLLLPERPEFQAIAKDSKFHEFWQRQPPIGEFTSHGLIKPLLQNVELYRELMTLAGSDLPDLHTYLIAGQSPKYGEEKILGRWKFDQKASVNRATRTNPNMDSAQKRYLRTLLATTMGNAVLTATIDNKIFIKAPAGKKQGSWTAGGLGKYKLAIPEGEVEATVDATRLSFTREKIPFVFARE